MKYRNIIIVLLTIMVTYGCQPDPDEYARPKNLAGTIYTQLQAEGDFEYYIKCLEQTPYVEPLLKGGAWTVFVPTDEAFEKFMQDEGYSSFEAIPVSRIRTIVDYTLLDNSYNTTKLAQNYSRGPGRGLKRPTQFRDTVAKFNGDDFVGFKDVVPGQEYFIDQSSGRDKLIHYFMPAYYEESSHLLVPSDYDFLFPTRTSDNQVGDMRVSDAKIIHRDLVAENGFIHVIDKVIEPAPTLYQNLSSEDYITTEYPEGKYSIFRSIVNRFGSFNDNAAPDGVNEVTGEFEKRYYLNFLTGIDDNNFGFNLADEVYPQYILNGTSNSWEYHPGLLVPTNKALEDYLANGSLLGSIFTSYDEMPLDVLAKFINVNVFAHFWSLCPSNEGNVFAETKDQINYSATNDAVDRKFCSNGFFVGVDKVYESTSFSTVVGPMLLNTEYSVMFAAVQALGIEATLQSQGLSFSILGVKNDQFIDVEDPGNEKRTVTVYVNHDNEIFLQTKTTDTLGVVIERTYPDSLAVTSGDLAYVKSTISAIITNQIVEKEIVLGSQRYYQTKSGEYIYVGTGNKISGGGDIFNNKIVEVVDKTTYTNGVFYEMSSFIERPLHYVYGSLTNSTDRFSSFIQVLEAADVLIGIIDNKADRLTGIISTSRSYTLLVPNNDAINQAVIDGVIENPDPAHLATLSELDRANATIAFKEFAQRHFLQDPIPTDGLNEVKTIRSLYVERVDYLTPIYQEFMVESKNGGSSLNIKNATTTNIITSTGGVTNLMSKRVVIHEIENYLK